MFGAIAGAIGDVASTILGNNSAKHEAERNRDWQEEMSNTSIQRRMADLKAAGLNPLLAVSSASSGASTPTGAQAQLKHLDFSQIINAYLAEKQGKVADTQAEKNIADAEKSEAEKNKIITDTEGQTLDNKIKQYERVRAGLLVRLEQENINARKLQNDLARINTERGKIEYLKEQKLLDKLDIEVKSEEDKARYLKAIADLAENDARSFENSPTGRAIKYGFDRVKDIFDMYDKFKPNVYINGISYNKTEGTSKTNKKRSLKNKK